MAFHSAPGTDYSDLFSAASAAWLKKMAEHAKEVGVAIGKVQVSIKAADNEWVKIGEAKDHKLQLAVEAAAADLEYPIDYRDERQFELVRLLDRAIPPEAITELLNRAHVKAYMSGTDKLPQISILNDYGEQVQQFNLGHPGGRVAAFNDTRTTPDEIVEWYERAQLLAGHPA